MVVPSPLYVGFSHGRGFWRGTLARIIILFTGGVADHSFLLYRKAGQWVTLGANADGVSYIPLRAFVRSHRVVGLFCPVTGSLWSGLQALGDVVGVPYDYTGLIGMAEVEIVRRWFHLEMPNLIDNPRKWFCSKLTSTVIRRAGYKLGITSPANTISPADEMTALLKNPVFKMYPVSDMVK